MPPSRPFKPARPLVMIYAVGIVVLAAAWVWRHYFTEHAIGAGPAGPAVARESFQRVWRDGAVVVLGLGDSVTVGYGSGRGHSSGCLNGRP